MSSLLLFLAHFTAGDNRRRLRGRPGHTNLTGKQTVQHLLAKRTFKALRWFNYVLCVCAECGEDVRSSSLPLTPSALLCLFFVAFSVDET